MCFEGTEDAPPSVPLSMTPLFSSLPLPRPQCNDATTHVVASVRGTEKTFWAQQQNRHVVSPAWLECSCVLWRRALEDHFVVPLLA